MAAAAELAEERKAGVPLHPGGAKGGRAGLGAYRKPSTGKGKAAEEGKGSEKVGLSTLQNSRKWKGLPETI